MPFIFEGDFDLGAVGLDLAVGNDDVLLNDLRHAQLAQMLGGALHRDLGGFLPGFSLVPITSMTLYDSEAWENSLVRKIRW